MASYRPGGGATPGEGGATPANVPQRTFGGAQPEGQQPGASTNPVKMQKEREKTLAGPQSEYQQAVNAPRPPPTPIPDIQGYTNQWMQQHNSDLLQGHVGLLRGMFLGIMGLGAAFGNRDNLRNANAGLGGLDGLMKGFLSGNKNQAAQGLQNYKIASDAMLTQYDLEDRKRTEILQDRQMNIEEKRIALETAAAQVGDKQAAALLEEKKFADYDKLNEQRRNTAERLKMQRDRLEADLYKKFVFDPNAKEKTALEKDVATDQKHADDAMKGVIKANSDLSKAMSSITASEESIKTMQESLQMAVENQKQAAARLKASQDRLDAFAKGKASALGGAPPGALQPGQGSGGGAEIGGGEEPVDQEKAISDARAAVKLRPDLREQLSDQLQDMGIDPSELDTEEETQ
jgi:hypothetical protein